jgi:rRNA biogenesis protein RRP5
MSTLEEVFSRGIQESKGKLLFLSLADTYESADDIEGAAAVLERALKRHKKSKQVWIRYHALYIKQGDDKKAKQLLSRSIQSLARHKHVEVISKYALAEFEYGSIDRGRVLFEDLLSSYPRRSDLWHVYVDREVKQGNVVQARQIFDRMIHAKFSTKAMQALFKKYLQFESKHGGEEEQERVREMAKQYVTGLMK